MDADRTREALAERRERWMQQRQAELDRKKAEESCLAATQPPAAHPHQPHQQASPAVPPQPAEVLDRLAEQIASRLQVELAALRQTEGLTAWGDGVAAQREHMAALRDEIMELRTLLGPGQTEGSVAGHQLNGPQVLSVQDLQRLCQS